MKENFELYYQYLIQQNNIHNLTAVTKREEVWVKHFDDSLAGLNLMPYDADILDIGAGAGFPSVPLKIVRDDLSITMIDSVKKKVDFLNGLIEFLGLNKITAKHIRAEDMRRASAAQYDVCVARAVARLNVLSEYALPFVKVGGIFIAYKSADIDGEIEEAKTAFKILGGEVDNIKKYTLDCNGEKVERKLVVIKKINETPSQYPRGGNKPRLKPL